MRINLDDLHQRIRTDYSFKKRLRKIIIFGGIGVLFLGFIAIIGIVFFSSAIIGFVFTNIPVVYEIAFNYGRDLAASYSLENLTDLLKPFVGGVNGTELNNLVTQYFEQLRANPSIDFKSFQNFITTIKSAVVDNQITGQELDLVRQFLLN